MSSTLFTGVYPPSPPLSPSGSPTRTPNPALGSFPSPSSSISTLPPKSPHVPYSSRLKRLHLSLNMLPDLLAPPSRPPSPIFLQRVEAKKRTIQIMLEHNLYLGDIVQMHATRLPGIAVTRKSPHSETDNTSIPIPPLVDTEEEWIAWGQLNAENVAARTTDETDSNVVTDTIEQWRNHIFPSSQIASARNAPLARQPNSILPFKVVKRTETPSKTERDHARPRSQKAGNIDPIQVVSARENPRLDHSLAESPTVDPEPIPQTPSMGTHKENSLEQGSQMSKGIDAVLLIAQRHNVEGCEKPSLPSVPTSLRGSPIGPLKRTGGSLADQLENHHRNVESPLAMENGDSFPLDGFTYHSDQEPHISFDDAITSTQRECMPISLDQGVRTVMEDDRPLSPLQVIDAAGDDIFELNQSMQFTTPKPTPSGVVYEVKNRSSSPSPTDLGHSLKQFDSLSPNSPKAIPFLDTTDASSKSHNFLVTPAIPDSPFSSPSASEVVLRLIDDSPPSMKKPRIARPSQALLAPQSSGLLGMDYNSQFQIESNVAAVTKFLEDDVWDI